MLIDWEISPRIYQFSHIFSSFIFHLFVLFISVEGMTSIPASLTDLKVQVAMNMTLGMVLDKGKFSLSYELLLSS